MRSPYRSWSRPWALWVSALALLVGGCGRSPDRTLDAPLDPRARAVHTTAAQIDDGGFVSAAAELSAGAEGRGLRPPAAVAPTPGPVGKSVDIPAGTFASGSAPGDEGREARAEPALTPVVLGGFSIDALPYPGDPATAPRLVSSAREAAAVCAESGARLCTELEWERVCKGPNDDPFATGAAWNVACDQAPSQCASGFGAKAMGFMAEWTDSVFAPREDIPVLRGGPTSGHRCAARVRNATNKSSTNGTRKTSAPPMQAAFRCCRGERNDVGIAPIESKPAFRKTAIEVGDLSAILADVPQLARLSEGVRMFSEADVKTIVGKSTAPTNAITLSMSPILWSPDLGVELLVATGRAKKTGFVVALWTVPGPGGETKYRFASSFLFLNDATPVALAYEQSRRKELRWTSCWGCAGEQGAISVRDDGRVVIVQH